MGQVPPLCDYQMLVKGVALLGCRNAATFNKAALKEIRALLNPPPSRAQNAYALFYTDRFQALRSKNPELPVIEAARQLGQEWRSLGEEEKQVRNVLSLGVCAEGQGIGRGNRAKS